MDKNEQPIKKRSTYEGQITVDELRVLNSSGAEGYLGPYMLMKPAREHKTSLDEILDKEESVISITDSEEEESSSSEIQFGQEQPVPEDYSDQNSSYIIKDFKQSSPLDDSVIILSDSDGDDDDDEGGRQVKDLDKQNWKTTFTQSLWAAADQIGYQTEQPNTHQNIVYQRETVDFFITAGRHYLQKSQYKPIVAWTVNEFAQYVSGLYQDWVPFQNTTQALVVQEAGQYSCVLLVNCNDGVSRIIHLNSNVAYSLSAKARTALCLICDKVFADNAPDSTDFVVVPIEQQARNVDSAIHALEYWFRAVIDIKALEEQIWAGSKKFSLGADWVTKRRDLYYRVIETANQLDKPDPESAGKLFEMIAKEIQGEKI